MQQLLLMPHAEIKVEKRAKASVLTPVRQIQLVSGSIRMIKFVLGDAFSELFTAAMYRVLPCLQTGEEDASLSSGDSRDMTHSGLQEI